MNGRLYVFNIVLQPIRLPRASLSAFTQGSRLRASWVQRLRGTRAEDFVLFFFVGGGAPQVLWGGGGGGMRRNLSDVRGRVF